MNSRRRLCQCNWKYCEVQSDQAVVWIVRPSSRDRLHDQLCHFRINFSGSSVKTAVQFSQSSLLRTHWKLRECSWNGLNFRSYIFKIWNFKKFSHSIDILACNFYISEMQLEWSYNFSSSWNSEDSAYLHSYFDLSSLWEIGTTESCHG